MNTDGRVSICGFISQYNLLEPPKGTTCIYTLVVSNSQIQCFVLFHVKARPVTGLILFKQLTVQGFMVVKWLKQWPEAFKEIEQWIQEVSCNVNIIKWPVLQM